ncbi:MAG: cryptochrome/photolyase family protein [Woeseiaceae bacterium]
MHKVRPTIVWFRQDLRLTDNPALITAVDSGAQILPIYILDDENAGDWKMGGASRWWLHQSLESLDKSLQGELRLLRGDAAKLLPSVAEQVNAEQVVWNRCYEPWRIARDRLIMAKLREVGVTVKSHNGSLLFEPQGITKADGTPYKVFTPFYRKGCLAPEHDPRPVAASPKALNIADDSIGVTLADLELMPRVPWYRDMARHWSPGEEGAQARLKDFLATGIQNYQEGRNRPDKTNCSRLSPHLHFGEISPHQVWQATRSLENRPALRADVDHFRSELGWREFSHYLLYHWPQLPRDNLQEKFDRFPWREDAVALAQWQRGETGYPIVDAGMRELWRTGFMHNRVRMIVASFLVKNLLLHWHNGEAWFWDTLVDADLANNSASWQWVAGSGADAAPYFRIFNPVLQGQKFDPDGDYVRTYVKEVALLPKKYIHNPWEAPTDVLAQAGVSIGENYPQPMVDRAESRDRALAAFKSISAAA